MGDAVDFDIAGPFDIEREKFKNGRLITKGSIDELWDELDDWHDGLAGAVGCYVFGIRAAKGIIPYYAGQALKRPILDEAFNASNILKYNEALADKKAGTPVLFVLPWLTTGGKYRKPSSVESHPTLDFLEDWLIGAALQRNKNLINNKKTKFLRDVHVTGSFNATKGEHTTDSSQFNAMMWKS